MLAVTESGSIAFRTINVLQREAARLRSPNYNLSFGACVEVLTAALND